MLDKKTFDGFTSKINSTYQQFCIWMYTNNEFVEHQKEWNWVVSSKKNFRTEEFSRDKGCKYKNFWDVIIPTLQHGWILGVARLFDSAYFSLDSKKENPRMSLDYILKLLDDITLERSIRDRIKKHETTIKSIKKQRDNFLAHNDIEFSNTKIEAGIEDLFKTLDNIITEIKNKKPHLKNCNDINQEYTEKLSKCGVDEIFKAL